MSNREKVLICLVGALALFILISSTWMLAKSRFNSSADVKNLTPSPPVATNTTTGSQNNNSVAGASEDVTLVLQPGYNLKTIPYILSPNDGKIVFLGLADRQAYYLNSSSSWTSLYQNGTISPGQGYWIWSEKGEAYKLPVNAKGVNCQLPFTISLQKGWNAVGNPCPKDIVWNPTVKTTKGTTTYQKAIDGKILTVSYRSEPVSQKYVIVNPGDSIKAFDGLLIESGGDVDLVISAQN